jgi:hypothetical protein
MSHTKKMKLTAYPKFKLKFFVDDKEVNSLRTRKLQRIIYRIRLCGDKFKSFKAFLGFYYAPHFHNEGYYYNLKDLEHAYRCFVEMLPEFNIK